MGARSLDHVDSIMGPGMVRDVRARRVRGLNPTCPRDNMINMTLHPDIKHAGGWTVWTSGRIEGAGRTSGT